MFQSAPFSLLYKSISRASLTSSPPLKPHLIRRPSSSLDYYSHVSAAFATKPDTAPSSEFMLTVIDIDDSDSDDDIQQPALTNDSPAIRPIPWYRQLDGCFLFKIAIFAVISVWIGFILYLAFHFSPASV